MILIGQYDSPFVRRIAVALQAYGFDYEHRPWSTFGQGDLIAPFNPLRRVPTLILADGEVLIESFAILDWLDERAGTSEALIARGGSQRSAALRVCALATGLCDKMVSLVYEWVLHEAASPTWVDRCHTQIAGVLDVLDADRRGRATPFWFGDRLGHADIAVTCAMRFLTEAHPDLGQSGRWPAMAAHAQACEALPVFKAVVQPFIAPGR
jgi:glutathione S-transferase